ncbi:MAG: AMP-binding protein [Planctomycetota bacterium]
MAVSSPEHRRRLEALDEAALKDRQLARLNDLISAILPSNQFYADKFAGLEFPLTSWERFYELPFTSKDEMLASAGTHARPANLSWPIEQYVYFHRTSGTRGRPLAVYDTAEDWRWWIESWQFVLDAAEIESDDRAMLAFSFGPFIGFWSAHAALIERGTLAIPGGGMSSLARLNLIEQTSATTLLCTPTYALHLAETAAEHKIDLASLGVRKMIVAGEAGGSIVSTRQRIESAWQAQVVDHAGASEVGPWGYADAERVGLHVLQSEFIPEFFSVETGDRARPGELAHLVITALGRRGMPAIRYRTGDLVRPTWPEGRENRFVLLRGGVLGRADDMMVIRGVNLFPSSVEQILRSFPEVVEYRLTARRKGAMDEVEIEVEDRLRDSQRIANELQLRLGLRIAVRQAPMMSLPRYEGKGRRFVDERDGVSGNA